MTEYQSLTYQEIRAIPDAVQRLLDRSGAGIAAAGAAVRALDPGSPLAAVADRVIDIAAGPERSVAAADTAETTIAEAADAMAAKGARVFATTDRVTRAVVLPCVRTGHWLTDPLALIVSFCAMVERLAVARGINPDAPRDLRKVTETL